jgi:hypothetical protein
MPIDDPNTWMQGAAAAKAAVDGIRSAIKMVKDIRGLGGGTEQEQKAIDVALTTAASNTAIAEATLGQAFGYQLCRCEFPPTPMRTVGYVSVNLANGMKVGDQVSPSTLPNCAAVWLPPWRPVFGLPTGHPVGVGEALIVTSGGRRPTDGGLCGVACWE